MNAIDWISLMLVVVGAINWGLVGIGMFFEGNANLINFLIGEFVVLEALAYLLVGSAGLYELYFAYKLYSDASRTTRREQAT